MSSTLDKVWIVWALAPGDLRVVAICTTASIARRYHSDAAPLFPNHRLAVEIAPLDHIFGASDLKSVAFRAAINKGGL